MYQKLHYSEAVDDIAQLNMSECIRDIKERDDYTEKGEVDRTTSKGYEVCT